ncbi:tyrosine-type recombinase/integrase [Rhodoplanes sp. Z2-YC6860]|uniref:tyrosine-type recombinase/integrase n=1 Tax=Rhodoplanes sp. Z2-YC6860 TaxID=674703 RepID=UPI00078B6324|nr:site-specific integrase [Rhodoplanes sp. Z2-YC6860]AMN40489.1 integrase family protein [Rhodoplanes sp. Z2-YC6860]
MQRELLACGSLYSASGQRKYLNHDERRRFIAAALSWPHPRVTSLCLVLAYTGCRISEALGLTEGCIEWQSGCIAIRSLKKRKKLVVVRQVPVPPLCTKALKSAHQLPGSNPDQRLWGWSRSRAWQLVKAVMQKALIAPGIHASPKGLRHGFGLHAVRSGVPLNMIQRWLGHASLTTTAIYLQAMGTEEHAIAMRMWCPAERRQRSP